jgi:hypothetical protein
MFTIKFWIALVVIALLSFVAGVYYLPWYSIAIIAFLVSALIHQKPLKSFLCGFLAIFILWGLLALVIDVKNEHLLSSKMATVFKLGSNGTIMILLTAFIGGLVAGLAALSASYLRATPKVKLAQTQG